jgi:hypothetical protein
MLPGLTRVQQAVMNASPALKFVLMVGAFETLYAASLPAAQLSSATSLLLAVFSAHSPPGGRRGRAARDRRVLVRCHGRLRPRRASRPVRRHAHPAPGKFNW